MALGLVDIHHPQRSTLWHDGAKEQLDSFGPGLSQLEIDEVVGGRDRPMASPRPPSLSQAHHYRLPDLLHDIRLLDLLELCGTTVQTSRLLQLSQPLVGNAKRAAGRYRLLSEDFGLVRDRRQLWGCGYCTSASMRLLRLGCRAHRLAAGVARIGSDLLHHPLLAGCPWLLPTPQRFRAAANWLELVRQGVLDGALISGLELE